MSIRVLHLIDSGGLYGAEKMLLALAKAQLNQGLEPVILSAGEPANDEKPLELEARRLGLPIKPWRMKPGFNIREGYRIVKWALNNNFDILHSHGFKFNILVGCYPKACRRMPMVATLHGYVHARRFSKIWFYELLDRVALALLQGVVLVGDAMKRELPSVLLRGEKVRVIPNGLDIKGIQAQADHPIDLPIEDFLANHSPVVLGVGRLSQEKGFDRLVESFQILCQKYHNPGLIIVGEGKERDRLDARITELGLSDKALMPGYCSNVPGLQRRSDLLVMPSHTEGLPITLLEAMAVGITVLVSPVGEMPAVVGEGEGGYLLAKDCNSEDLGKHIVSSLNDSQREVKAKWSISKVVRYYSVEAMEERYREVYIAAMGVAV
ncbi:glycosyltransferase [Marinobacter sp. S0848L]|uniref:glycosyltransferase n=1 Tax=Marinobacter sp. S0848L TaxID=2926423 RepID=UPI001FF47549|nr:glycosyltransferase [Marinobacter sp. S0848L]MCK0105467.1 glycosyltransferase [Marinobacter sp. S0848L]